MSTLGWLAFVVTLGTVIGLGIRAGKATTDHAADFFLGGRNWNAWRSAIASFAAAESGFVFLGLVGMAYRFGFVTLWILVGVVYGYLGTWGLMARPIRHISETTGALSVPQLIQGISGSKGSLVLRVGGALVFVTMTMYAGVQFHAVGKALQGLGSLDLMTGTIVGALVITGYSAYGGLRSISHTDVSQGALMLGTLLLLGVFSVGAAGGPAHILATMEATSPALVDPTGGASGAKAVLLPFFFAIVGLGLTGAPHYLRKFMATSTSMRSGHAGWIAMSCCFVLFVSAMIVGFAARGLDVSPADPEAIVPLVTARYFTGALAIAAGVVFAGVLSAMASTADSQLLEATAAVTEDFGFGRRLRRRVVMWGTGAIALALALWMNESIFERTLLIWAVTGAAFGPALLLGIAGVRATDAAYATAMVLSAGLVAWWDLASPWGHDVYALVPGFLVSGLVVLAGRRRPAVEARSDASPSPPSPPERKASAAGDSA